MTDSSLAGSPALSLLYLPSEPIYGAVATRCLENGWALIPQERAGRRGTAQIDGRALKWGQYTAKAPSAREVKHWSLQAPTSNGAILLGVPSGLVFAIDIDVYEEDLSMEIQNRADEILGVTRFMRQGQAPKMAMFYRVKSVEDLPANRSWRLLDGEHKMVTQNGLEILGHGRLITAYGYHHKTDKYFVWEGPQPFSHATTDVPVVTPARIEEFVAAVQDIRPFHRNAGNLSATAEFSTDGEVKMPKLTLADGRTEWVEKDGIVVDGREAYLWSLANITVRGNADVAVNNPASLRGRVFERFKETAEMSGKWSEGYLRTQAAEKVDRAIRDLKEGRSKPLDTSRPMIRSQIITNDSEWLILGQRRKQQLDVEFAAISEEEKASRALNLDRASAGDRTAASIRAALSAAFDAAYDGRVEEIHVIPGPTGSGKTSQAIAMIAADPRTYQHDDIDPDSDDHPGPWAFVLPTYNNVNELKRRADVLGLDPDASDDEFVAAAEAKGILLEGSKEIRDALAQARGADLRAESYKGKKAAGCLIPDVLGPLQAAGVTTGALCKSRKKNECGEMVDAHCKHYETCPAILQRKAIKGAHVVFLVQNFLTLNLPEELKKVRGTIIDERHFHLLVHETYLSIDTLKMPRREPRLTKDEIKAGMAPQDLLHSRDKAADIVLGELEAGRDPVAALAKLENGTQLANEAQRVNGSAMSIDQAVYPNMSAEAVKTLLEKPTGTELGQEYRFWKVVAERLMDIKLGRAKGETDSRLQFLPPKRQMRVSWQDEMNWSSVTRILLDASVDREITSRLFPQSNIVVHDIETDINLRVLYVPDQNWAISGLVPAPEDEPTQLLGKATRISMIRDHISIVSGLYAHGAVVYVLPKAVREIVEKDWIKPYNVDIRHHGAVKGLDFGRRHVAVVALGRQEPPMESIDAQVGAITHRDEQPEEPVDKFGTGFDENGKGVRQIGVKRRIKMRDKDAILPAQEYGGPLARAVQKQYREEETRQIIGRVRPVFRQDTTDAIVIGQALPEDVIVDAVAPFNAMFRGAAFWDLVRRCGGIIDFEGMAARSIIPMTVADAKAMLDDFPDKDVILARFHAITSRDSDGKTVLWWLPGYIADDLEGVKAYAQACAPSDEIVEIKLCEMSMPPAARAPADEISTANGDATAQDAAETRAWAPIVETLTKRGMLKKSTLHAAGLGELERHPTRLGAWPIIYRWMYERAAIIEAQTSQVVEVMPLDVAAEQWLSDYCR